MTCGAGEADGAAGGRAQRGEAGGSRLHGLLHGRLHAGEGVVLRVALDGELEHLLEEQRVDAHPLHRPEEQRGQRRARARVALRLLQEGRHLVVLARARERAGRGGLVAAVDGVHLEEGHQPRERLGDHLALLLRAAPGVARRAQVAPQPAAIEDGGAGG